MIETPPSKGPIMHSAFALMLLSLASAGTQAATVQGSVKVVQDGRSFDCVGVFLIPRSPENDAAVEQKFGNLNDGVQATPPARLSQVKSDPPQGSRRSRCRGAVSEKFEFSQVPPGEYFLTMTALPRRRYEQEKFRPRTVEMMRRVSVALGSRVKFNFRYSD